MGENTVSLNDKIARLRGIFIEQLPGRMTEARRLFDILQTDPSAAEAAGSLHRYLHNTKGTGASFGFLELSVLSGKGEDLAKTILESPGSLTSESWQQLGECLTDMERVLEQAALQGDNPPAHTEQNLIFEIPPPNHTPDESSNERLIYICDDEILTAEQLGAQLQCFGYQTMLFNNTADLRAAVLAKQPAAVIMDIVFPEGKSEGTNVLANLRRIHGIQFPAIFVSARRDFDARLRAIQAGGEAYFPKPVSALELVASLDFLTRHSEPESFRVLVVDDEPEIAQYHALILENAGMVTRTTHVLETVLDVVGEFKPDLVLMDMYMPRCSGHDIAKLIRQVPDYIGLPIVFLSSETDPQKQFSAMRVGVEGFLTKPIEPGYLVTSVALRAERMRVLRSLMMRDSLTGLFNHTAITQFLDSAIVRARRQDHAVCFAMIDVDRFKSVNDNYGHPVGDQVLLALARVLQQRLRDTDLVGRYGGEEFAVIMHDVTLEKAEQTIQQLREDFSKVLFHSGDVDFSCSFSCGVAAFPQLKCVETLIEAADKAMYQAKHSGRNRVVVYAA
ncbi:MAG: diguanylate cyclase [Methylovulum sp.]|nr:diguanylate cyclase [Methylovulum sp.]